MRIDLYFPRAPVGPSERPQLCCKAEEICLRYGPNGEHVFVNGMSVDRVQGNNTAIHCIPYFKHLAPGNYDLLCQRLAIELAEVAKRRVLVLTSTGELVADSKNPPIVDRQLLLLLQEV